MMPATVTGEPIPNPANFAFEGRVFTPAGASTRVTGSYKLKPRDEFYWDTWLRIDAEEESFPSTDYHESIGNPKATTSMASALTAETEVLTWWITPPVDRIATNFPILLLRFDRATGLKSYLAAGLCYFTSIEAAS
jgi:hypothetical protein